ncbi:MAG: amino acid adenylation domain-containing protein, partial [Candidatus Methylumidiphilus sp.]
AEQGGQFHCSWEYATDLFAAETVERMAAHFEALLEALTLHPQQAIGSVPMLTEGDIQQLQAWNDTATDYPQDKTLVGLFEAQVERTPENIAVVFEEQTLTYRQLNEKANRLARHLLSLAKPDGQPLLTNNPLIAIAVERSLEMVIGLLAILKAGGAYVPIDPSYPAARIRYMLGDSQAPLLLTQSHLTEALALADLEHDCVVLCLDQTDVAGQPSENLSTRSTAEDLAYVIYTSGTTGNSKGCQVTQLNVTRLFAVTEDYYHFNDRDVWTLFHSYAFDFSVWEIWGALIYGGCMVIVPYFTSRSPEDFYQLLIEQKVTVLNQTPSAFKQLINVDTQANDLSLRLVIFGGEALDFASLQPWFDHHGDQQPQLVNMYGITETTVHVTFYPITREQTLFSSVIGKPLPDLNVWLVDANWQPVPIGIPGEILVGGGGVARGYLNRPELTAEKFVEIELFGKTERVYKTGDLARWLPDGNLEFLGRIDHQIKLRGFRIELGEIEAVLTLHESIKEAVVSLYEADGDKRLVAYLVVSGQWLVDSGQKEGQEARGFSSSLTTGHQALVTYLKSRLPDYMIPASFMILDSLPLTPNGKIDRKALPAPELQASTGFSQPNTPTEELLAVCWANVLKREAVGRDDNFFELGGHSLLATQLVSRIRESFRVELPIRAIFEHPELARLAAAIDNAGGTQALPPIAKQAETTPKVLSFGQQWFWLLSQFDSQDTAHHMFYAWKLAGHLDEDALRQTFSALVARHQSLRLCFPQIGGSVGVAVLPAYDPLTTLDISHLPEALRGPRLIELQQEAIRQPFTLTSGPLFRVRLIKAAGQEHYLFLTVHHIIFDAWSTGILLRDWQTLYTALCQGQTPELPGLPIDYTDYAAWQRS